MRATSGCSMSSADEPIWVLEWRIKKINEKIVDLESKHAKELILRKEQLKKDLQIADRYAIRLSRHKHLLDKLDADI